MPDNVILTTPSEIDKLAEALSKAQAAIVPPKKSHTAKVPTKAGSTYSYTYSTLDELVDALRKPLAANGLSFVQRIIQRDHHIGVETTILHASGQSLDCGLLMLPSGDTPQAMGSALSYARRYSLSAAFGVAAEDDDDGATAQRETTAKPINIKVARPSSTPVAAPAATTIAPAPTREPGDEPDDVAYTMGINDAPDAELFDEPVPEPPPVDPREARLRLATHGSPTISEPRQKRLFAVAKAHGWTNETIKTRLARYGFEHTRDIPVSKYDDVISMFEETAP